MQRIHKNGTLWRDTDGNPIQAHGGCIIRHNDMWYWYGENKGQDNCPGKDRVDVIGVSCYSSCNLADWRYEGLALAADKDNPEGPLHPSKVLERPKVIYNEKTKKFVMLFHSDDAEYLFCRVGIAISDTPEGPYEFIKTIRPNNFEAMDMTVFRDVDSSVYLFHTIDRDKTMNITRLTDDYMDTDGEYVSVLKDQLREAPAICIDDGKYYMVTSGCTGWNPNSALYAESKEIMGEWCLIDNPCEGENYRKTFYGQSTYIFEVNDQKYLMLDHWQPYDLKNSGYSILPITFEDGIMSVKWQDEWRGIWKR